MEPWWCNCHVDKDPLVAFYWQHVNKWLLRGKVTHLSYYPDLSILVFTMGILENIFFVSKVVFLFLAGLFLLSAETGQQLPPSCRCPGEELQGTPHAPGWDWSFIYQCSLLMVIYWICAGHRMIPSHLSVLPFAMRLLLHGNVWASHHAKCKWCLSGL